jgi:hypothetical protein
VLAARSWCTSSDMVALPPDIPFLLIANVVASMRWFTAPTALASDTQAALASIPTAAALATVRQSHTQSEPSSADPKGLSTTGHR